jgi:pimeloyl-ACP methyl ester carboxylesterase
VGSWRIGKAVLAGGAAALVAVSAAPAQSPPGDPGQYCQGDGGPYGMVTDAEHNVLLGEAPLPPRVRTSRVTVDGVATRVLEAGPAHARDAVVYIHGNPGSARDFDKLMSSSGRYARTIALDISGYGQSDKSAAQVQSTDGAAKYIGGVLDQLGVRRVVLVAHDFGGIWGLQWAVQHPDALTGVVLIDTGVLIDYVPHPLAVIFSTPEAGELYMAQTTRDSFKDGINAQNPRPLPPDYLDRMYDNYDRAERCAALRYYRSAGQNLNLGRDQAAVLVKRSRPALVIWGKQDPYVPPDQAEKQKQAFPDAQIHIFDDSGHWPFIDNARKTRKLVVPFLRPTLAVSRPHARARARRLRVRVQVNGMLPAYRVRARIRTIRQSRPRTVRGARTLIIHLRRPLHARRYSLRVRARGLPPQHLSFTARR